MTKIVERLYVWEKKRQKDNLVVSERDRKRERVRIRKSERTKKREGEREEM